MNKVIVSLAVVALVGVAKADTTVLFPDGDFDSPAGARGPWEEVGGGTTWSYPTTGGNPNGYGIMDGTGGWGIWVGGATTPIPIGPMGLVAGGTYTFVQDMKTFASLGNPPAGVKIESWGPTGLISSSGDMRAFSESAAWETYSFIYSIAPGATGIKVVPLWSAGARVGYDNIGVIVPPQPLVVEIGSPTEGSIVGTNFTIAVSAAVSPGSVTNVYFYDGVKLLGNDTNYPYTFAVTGAALGAHELTAVAKDSAGNSATSIVVNVIVEGVAPPPLTYPVVNAPNPIWPAVNVNSMYNSSGAYTDRAPINWYPWGATSSRGDYKIVPGGSTVKSYLGLGYAGVELNPSYNPATPYDASRMTTLHLDVWTTANQLAIKMVSTANGAAPLLIYDAASGVITSNNWVSLDIPLSVFTNINPALDLTKLDQVLWVDNGDIPGPGVRLGDFYFDNVFFYNNTPVIQAPAVAGTNFTMKVASQIGISYVVQGTPVVQPTAWTSIQTNAGTGGLLNFTVPMTPGNSKRFFRVVAQ